ncbi:sugar ABC transporter substrate-binding protein [Kitasatospora sp. MMS16-BH015]|uniref:substrate-binding domain-containing protein n=1 Tax=Kitasatospora sp. MMS16-BH015 TaxID=2018025 RepID=UPI000CA28ACE|nr:substrate-binding domain-containing protein [Kitasatospora sp. MMS16-BH015]AUG80746.1 sugar ABC transporter substrate-binding protein [Kitasatospora sp. MMS16-BH015]
MSRPRPHRSAAVLGLVAAFGATACSSGGSDGAAPMATGRITLTYLQKQGDQGYFKTEATGARAKAAQLGVDLKVVDLGTDPRRAVHEVQAAAQGGSNGVIAVLPDPAAGPDVVQAANDARLPLLTSDDQVCASDPDPSACKKTDLVPRIGFNGSQLGAAIGKRSAEEYTKAGWSQSDTRIVSLWKFDVTVCTDRMNAAKDTFINTAGASIQKLDVPTDNTVDGAKAQLAQLIRAQAGVRHWIVWGCNDENVQGGIDALQAAGVPTESILGVGLGAYLACQDWQAGKPTGMKAALFINGSDVGARAVQTMYDRLRKGTPFPAEVAVTPQMVDAAGWRSSGLGCG